MSANYTAAEKALPMVYDDILPSWFAGYRNLARSVIESALEGLCESLYIEAKRDGVYSGQKRVSFNAQCRRSIAEAFFMRNDRVLSVWTATAGLDMDILIGGVRHIIADRDAREAQEVADSFVLLADPPKYKRAARKRQGVEDKARELGIVPGSVPSISQAAVEPTKEVKAAKAAYVAHHRLIHRHPRQTQGQTQGVTA